MHVDTTNYNDAANQIINWAVNGETRYVCVANVHMVMEAYDDNNLSKDCESGRPCNPGRHALSLDVTPVGTSTRG